MDLRAAMDVVRAAWSDAHVCRVARDFLEKCGWALEASDGMVRVPADAELLVYSAAVIVSDHGFRDHVEAVVYLGVERSPPNVFPVHGVLRLYLTAACELVTEDRYTVADWMGR